MASRYTLHVGVPHDLDGHLHTEMELLDRVGIPVVRDDLVVGVRAECLRVARFLASKNIAAVGLVPAGGEVAVPPIAVQLGLAMQDLERTTVAVVDANVRWPALAAGLDPAAEDDLSAFTTHWLFESLALLVPPSATSAGEILPRLEWLMDQGSEIFAKTIVDLTGFELVGELGAAAEILDGVVVVVGVGTTREEDVLRVRDLFEPDRLVGALLVG